MPTLDEVRIKEVADLTDEDKQLLAAHKDELSSDEQAKFELGGTTEPEAPAEGEEPEAPAEGEEPANTNVTPEATAVSANEKGQVTISASELESLQKAAAQGVSANEKLIRKEAEDHITSKAFSASDGFKFPQDLKSDLVTLYVSASDEQKATIDKLLDAAKPMKSADEMGAQGSGADTTNGSAYTALSEKAAEIMKANEGMEFTNALLEARKQNPELASQYDTEYQAGKPQLATR